MKTMGDAILAVFRRPATALRAALKAQSALAAPRGGREALALKAAVHHGPCLAVNQNDRLDYFGSTVNAAARLVELSTGKDVVVSAAVKDEPEVASFLAAGAAALSAGPEEVRLKGFEGDRFEAWRVVKGPPRETPVPPRG